MLPYSKPRGVGYHLGYTVLIPSTYTEKCQQVFNVGIQFNQYVDEPPYYVISAHLYLCKQPIKINDHDRGTLEEYYVVLNTKYIKVVVKCAGWNIVFLISFCPFDFSVPRVGENLPTWSNESIWSWQWNHVVTAVYWPGVLVQTKISY